MTDEKRQGAACRKGFRQICFLPLFCVPTILSKVWISARQFFRFFFFDVFPFLGSGCKSRIVCRGFYMPASLRFLLSDCMACNQIFYFSSESVSFPFTSISMRSSPYRIRWSSPFRRKGNSGMLRYCKVGAFGFGENLHAYAPLCFAPGSIFPQKPCIRSSLPLWGT